MTKLYKQKQYWEEAGLYDVCEWFIETYPKDIFRNPKHPVVKIRKLAEEILNKRG